MSGDPNSWAVYPTLTCSEHSTTVDFQATRLRGRPEPGEDGVFYIVIEQQGICRVPALNIEHEVEIERMRFSIAIGKGQPLQMMPGGTELN